MSQYWKTKACDLRQRPYDEMFEADNPALPLHWENVFNVRKIEQMVLELYGITPDLLKQIENIRGKDSSLVNKKELKLLEYYNSISPDLLKPLMKELCKELAMNAL